MKIISIGSRPLLSANFHVQTFHHVSVSFPMFDSVDRCFTTFLLIDIFFTKIRCDPVVTERYTQVYLLEMPEIIHHYNVCTRFLSFLKLLIILCIVPKPDPHHGSEKKQTCWKNRSQGLKTLSFFSSKMKDNVEVIHFHVKSRCVQDLVFVQITFENCLLNFYFENSGIVIKKTILNLHPLFAWNVSACLHIFM